MKTLDEQIEAYFKQWKSTQANMRVLIGLLESFSESRNTTEIKAMINTGKGKSAVKMVNSTLEQWEELLRISKMKEL